MVLCANPSGGIVQNGDVSIKANNQEMTISQTSDKAVIHWQDFSIAKGEKTTFIQPSSSSQMLNRVVGSNSSEIYGALKSNGIVYIINPHGVIVGPSGTIDTHGFIASTFDVQDEDFLQGKDLHFKGDSSAKIINQGTILTQKGGVLLVAQEIENTGKIASKEGNVDLVAGYEVLLIPTDQRKVAIRLKKEGQVKNSGMIEAVEAKLQASGGSAYSFALDHQGMIEAKGIENRNGKIVLISEDTTSVAGKMKAQNENNTGGEINLLGQNICLEKDVEINASGNFGGGTILVGGDYQGKNPEIQNAQTVHVDKNATIHADAITEGNGGKIIFWGNQMMDFHGVASAEGGKNIGDGGFIEVSSHGIFFVDEAKISSKAYRGKCGTLLFDPVDVTISSEPNSGIYSPTSPPPPHGGPYNYLFNEATANINVQNLIAFLADNHVTIDTNTGLSEQINNGDITIASAIMCSSGNHLTLKAERNIVINDNICLTGGGILTLYIGQNNVSGSLSFANNKTISGSPDASGMIVYGGTGANTIDYSGYTSAISINVESDYSGTATGIVGGCFKGIQSIQGGSGRHIYTIDGNMDTLCCSNTNNIMENLFVFNSGRVQMVNATSGINSFHVKGGTVETLIGAGSSDQIFGPTGGATWDIRDTNAGSLAGNRSGSIGSFSNVANVTGNTGNDSFIFHDGGHLTGDLNGGGGINTLDFTDCCDLIVMDMANQAVTHIDGAVTNIQNGKINEGAFFGDDHDTVFYIQSRGTIAGGSGNNTLISLDAVNTWTVGAASSNIVTSAPGGNIVFTGVQNLQGAGDNDTFILQGYGLMQTITGNGYSSHLIGPNGHSTWTITNTDAGNIHGSGMTVFTQIDSITGGSGDDTFIMNPGAKITGTLNGGGGYNILDYSSFRSPVIVDWKHQSATNINYFENIQRVIYSPETFSRANTELIVDTLGDYMTLSKDYSRLWKWFEKLFISDEVMMHKKKLHHRIKKNKKEKELNQI
jgi:filamentous hemagglutinin family protein